MAAPDNRSGCRWSGRSAGCRPVGRVQPEPLQEPGFHQFGLGRHAGLGELQRDLFRLLEGYWNFTCAAKTPLNRSADESVQASEAQSYAMHYIRSHESRLATVEGVRLGRAFGFFRPIQQIQLDADVETRPYHWALVGLGMYYAMLALSVVGVVLLRRRRIPVLPLLAVGLEVIVSVLLTFGNTRYRTPFEVSLVLLSAVTLDWMWSRLRGRGQTEQPDVEARPEPVPAAHAGQVTTGALRCSPSRLCRPAHPLGIEGRADGTRHGCARGHTRRTTKLTPWVRSWREVRESAPKVHILVVDDASTDATESLARKAGRRGRHQRVQSRSRGGDAGRVPLRRRP